MEAVECAAASLAIVLAYYGRHIPLEKLRFDCGVSRDGSNAADLIAAARQHGMEADGFKLMADSPPDKLKSYDMPLILYWERNHFLVLEGIKGKKYYINDPAYGPRTINEKEFKQKFSQVFITLTPCEKFQKTKNRDNVLLNVLRRVLPHKGHVILALLLSLTLIIPGIVLPGMSKVFIDEILVKKELLYLNGFITIMTLVVISKIAINWILESFIVRFNMKLSVSSSYEFMWHLLKVPMNFFSQRSVGDVISRLGAVNSITKVISSGISANLFQLIQAVVYLGVMFLYNVKLTLLSLFFVAINVLLFFFTKRNKRDIGMRSMMVSAKLTGLTINGISNIESLKCSGNEGDFFNKWSSYQANATNAGMQLTVLNLITGNVLSFCGSLSGALTLGVGAYLIIQGEISLGGLIGFQLLASQFNGPINSIISFGGQLQQIAVEIKRIDDVLDCPVDYKHSKNIDKSKSTGGDGTPCQETETNKAYKLTGKVELKNVTFGYSRLKPPLIKKFNLTLNPGDRIALVGTSGSGKSTIANLISGLFLPWEGEVLLDGVSIDKIDPELLANSLSMVDQSPFFFKGSIRGNLTFWDDNISSEDLKKVTVDAGIYDEIASRKDAFECEIYEGGGNFSGGQLQRMEIARSLLINPSILILDEATSALDPIREKYIYERIWSYGCSLIIIAHRLSAVRDCDEIIVLDSGNIVERGTHAHLVEQKGYYNRLIEAE